MSDASTTAQKIWLHAQLTAFCS